MLCLTFNQLSDDAKNTAYAEWCDVQSRIFSDVAGKDLSNTLDFIEKRTGVSLSDYSISDDRYHYTIAPATDSAIQNADKLRYDEMFDFHEIKNKHAVRVAMHIFYALTFNRKVFVMKNNMISRCQYDINNPPQLKHRVSRLENDPCVSFTGTDISQSFSMALWNTTRSLGTQKDITLHDILTEAFKAMFSEYLAEYSVFFSYNTFLADVRHEIFDIDGYIA